jgi:hypothetical protein
MKKRHVLLGSCGRPINIATKLDAAVFPDHDVFFYVNRRFRKGLCGANECAERVSNGGSRSYPQKRSPCNAPVVCHV